MADLEYCCECDAPTGRCGWGEDSMYIFDDGPFCEDCFRASACTRCEGEGQNSGGNCCADCNGAGRALTRPADGAAK